MPAIYADSKPIAIVRDAVEHPNHYCSGGVECIDAIRASMSNAQFAAYCKGNCLKYIWRYEHKNGLEDLEKAQVYLGWMIDAVKADNNCTVKDK